MNYSDLKKIGGGIVVTIGYPGTMVFEKRLFCVSDLERYNGLSIGQLFNAVRELNGKRIEDYGTKWPTFFGHFSDENMTNIVPSPQFTYIQRAFNNCTDDYMRLVLVCDQLGEEVPECISTEELKTRIAVFLNS